MPTKKILDFSLFYQNINSRFSESIEWLDKLEKIIKNELYFKPSIKELNLL